MDPGEEDLSTIFPPSSLARWTPPTPPQEQQGTDFPGQMGAAVTIPADRVEEALDLFSVHQFNLVASDLLSLNRTLPDARHEHCLLAPPPSLLPLVMLNYI